MTRARVPKTEWMTVGEVASYLGIDRRTARNLGEPGRDPDTGQTRPPRVRMTRPTGSGGHRRFWRADVEAIRREAGIENGPAEDQDLAEPDTAGPCLQHL